MARPTPVEKINLAARAAELPQAWRSLVVGQAAGANVKVLRRCPPRWRPAATVRW